MRSAAKRRVGNELTRSSRSSTDQRRHDAYASASHNANVFYSGDGHDHFHIERFIMVTLMPAPGNSYTMTERRLRKIGFCLVDSLRSRHAPPNQAPTRVYSCGNSSSTFVRMGISVGWGDIYTPDSPSRHRRHRPARRAIPDLRHGQPDRPLDREGQQLRQQLVVDGRQLDVANNHLSVIGSGDTPC